MLIELILAVRISLRTSAESGFLLPGWRLDQDGGGVRVGWFEKNKSKSALRQSAKDRFFKCLFALSRKKTRDCEPVLVRLHDRFAKRRDRLPFSFQEAWICVDV
jgi:hypothetical protein